VVVVGGYDKEGRLFVLEAKHFKEYLSKVMEAMVEFHKQYGVRFARIESVGGFAAIPGLFREYCVKNGVRLGVIPFYPTGRKEDRINYQLEPLFTNQAVWFHRKLSVNREMHQQLKYFPVYAHDDYPDALASLAGHAVKPKASTNKLIQKYEINQKYGGVR
jgi:predicted phage terminase large subunit-like protein